MGTVRTRDLSFRHAAQATELMGIIEFAGVQFGQVAAAFPMLAQRLDDVGIAAGDLSLDRVAAKFVATKGKDNSDALQPTRLDAEAEFRATLFGKPISGNASLKRVPGKEDVLARAIFHEFNPAEFGPRDISGLTVGNFDFPVGVQAEACFGSVLGELKAVNIQVRAGEGNARLPELGVLPFRRAAADMELDPSGNIIRAPVAPELSSCGVRCNCGAFGGKHD